MSDGADHGACGLPCSVLREDNNARGAAKVETPWTKEGEQTVESQQTKEEEQTKWIHSRQRKKSR